MRRPAPLGAPPAGPPAPPSSLPLRASLQTSTTASTAAADTGEREARLAELRGWRFDRMQLSTTGARCRWHTARGCSKLCGICITLVFEAVWRSFTFWRVGEHRKPPRRLGGAQVCHMRQRIARSRRGCSLRARWRSQWHRGSRTPLALEPILRHAVQKQTTLGEHV